MDLNILAGSFYLSCGLAVFLLGLLVYRESPEVRLHRVSALMLLFGGLGPALAGLGIFLGWRGPGAASGAATLAGSFAYVWEFFFPALLLFALVFPSEWPVLGRFPRLPAALFAPHGFHLVFLLLLGLIGERTWAPEIRSLPGGEGIVGTLGALGVRLFGFGFDLLTRVHLRFFSLINLVYSAAAVALLGRSWHTVRSRKLKRQLAAILFGLGTCMGLYVIAVPLPNLLARDMPAGARMVLVSVALLVGTGSIAFAILRRSFLDLGTVMRRAILLSGISGGLVVLYFLTARPMDRILLAETGSQLPVFQTLFVILVIVFFHPILGRVEETVDRLVAGDRAGRGSLLRRLGRDMTSILDLSDLASTLTGTLKETLALESAHLVLLDPASGLYRVVAGERDGALALESDHPLVRRMAVAGDAVLTRDLRDDTGDRAEREELERALGALGATLLVPAHLPEGGGCIGFLSLGPKLTGNRFNVEEMTVLSVLSTQVGIAIRNARLHEEAVARKIVDQELAMARSIQEAIVAGRRPALEGVDLAALTLPSRQVGGDYYDLIPLAGGRLGVAIGDVSGKGIPAALLMSMLHAGLHAQVNGSAAVAEVASRMNRILYHSTSEEKFATFFFGIYESRERRFLYTNAGHNYPLLLRQDGSVHRLREGGLILGVLEDAAYGEGQVPVEAGDLLVFYTDGVTEAADGASQEYGEERLLDAVRRRRELPADEIVREVRDEVSGFSGSEGFEDDFTLIVVRAF